jgi:hypothetical protein
MTLIEVVLAAALLALGVTALLTGASRCMAVMRLAKDYQTAEWTLGRGEVDHPMLATNKIEDLDVPEEEYPNGFRFSRTVEDDGDEDGLHVVRTRVRWGERGRKVEEVVSFVYELEEDE